MYRYSSWYSLQKAVAWILRFKSHMCHKYLPSKSKESPAAGPLTVQEIRQATVEIIRRVQQTAFPEELTYLESNSAQPRKSLKSLSATSALRKLNPVLHDKILRVGGRLERAPLSFDAKHPIILPNKHHVTELLIRSYHETTGHSGPTRVLAEIRHKFWIVQGHSAVRRVIGNCIDCKKRNADLVSR